jgi:LytS/YehU family sensor histidine kinase
MVVNSQGSHNQSNDDYKGNGIALNNIRERLFVLYDDQQAFRVRNDADKYQVIMRLPKKAYVTEVNLRRR